jgi:hypothetical protein
VSKKVEPHPWHFACIRFEIQPHISFEVSTFHHFSTSTIFFGRGNHHPSPAAASASRDMASSFPNELLELCFENLLEDGAFRQICDVLCVCHKWHKLFRPLVWADVAILKPATLATLINNAPLESLRAVRSLTISIDPIEPRHLTHPGTWKRTLLEDSKYVREHGNDGTRALWEDLQLLTRLLPQMTSLTTFSLHVNGQNNVYETKGFWLRSGELSDLILSLPKSVTNLEIDTKSYDVHGSGLDSSHPCQAIALQMPHLVNLRLQLSRYCRDIFTQSDHLRTLIIGMVPPERYTKTRECGDEQEHQYDPEAWRRQKGEQTRKMLIEVAQSHAERSSSLTKCLIIDLQEGNYGRCVDRIDVRDIISKTTTSFPLDYTHMKRTPYNHVALRYLENGATKDVCGRFGDLQELLEGPEWSTTSLGFRLPLSVRNSKQGRKHIYDDEWRFETREAFMERHGGHMFPSWSDEVNSGKPLLMPRVVKGLGETKMLCRSKLLKSATPDLDPNGRPCASILRPANRAQGNAEERGSESD